VGKGGKPKVEVTEYYMSEHFGVCSGPVDAILRIIVKEKDAWVGEQSELASTVINLPELFGGVKKEGGLKGVVTFLPGASDQVLPDTLAQRLGRPNGASAPGYRGITSLFFYGAGRGGVPSIGDIVAAKLGKHRSVNGFYWTANTPYLPGVWATVRRILKRSDGDEQWYPEKARIDSGYVLGSSEIDIQLVGVQSVDTSGGAGTGVVNFNLTNGIGATPQEGDFVIIIASASRYPLNSGAYAPTIAGYTEFASISYENLLADSTMKAFYKVMGSTPDTSWQASDPVDATAGCAYLVAVFRGVNVADPFAAEPETGLQVGVGSVNPPDIVIGDLIIDPGTIQGITFPYDRDAHASFALRSLTSKILPVVVGGDCTPAGLIGTGNLTTVFTNSVDASRRARAYIVYGEPVEIVTGDDMNPAHIIHECLTNRDWGMGAPLASIDEGSFIVAADALYLESFGLSLMWTRQTTIQEFVQEILDHIQAVLYVDPSTGLLTLSLIRGNYNPDDLPVIDPDNADLSNFSRKLWGDIVNEIAVTWTNPENEQEETITVQDDASIATQGGIVSDSRNYYGVRNADLAQRLAYRDLRSAGQPLASCEAEVDRTQWRLRPASVIKLTWPEYGLSEIVMRVTSIDYGRPGDMTIKLSLMEDVYGLDIGDYEPPPSSEWEDPSAPPAPLETVEIFTLPLFFAADTTVSAFVESPEYPEVLAGVLATDDSEDTFSYELWGEVALPNGDLEWQSLGTNNIIGRAVLAAGLNAEATSTGVEYEGLIGQTTPTAGGFAIIGDQGETGNEIAMIDAVDEDGTITLVRGVLDTVPRAWPAETPVWFVDGNTLFEDSLVRAAGETVEYKLLSRTSQGLLALESAPLESATLSERPWLPNRPADVKAHGEAWSSEDAPIDATGRSDPWVTVTWANRNRLTEDSQVLSWTDGDVTPEDGQTTTILVLPVDDDTPLATHDGLSGTSFDVPDSSFGTHAIVRLRVTAERTDDDGEFVALQYFEHWVQVEPLTFDSTAVTFDSDKWTMDNE
jgi:hypothetical protein